MKALRCPRNAPPPPGKRKERREALRASWSRRFSDSGISFKSATFAQGQRPQTTQQAQALGCRVPTGPYGGSGKGEELSHARSSRRASSSFSRISKSPRLRQTSCTDREYSKETVDNACSLGQTLVSHHDKDDRKNHHHHHHYHHHVMKTRDSSLARKKNFGRAWTLLKSSAERLRSLKN